MPSGLPRHHCAFPGSPFYLHSFATEKDLAVGTRHGLFAHLKYFFVPDRAYVPGLHNVAVKCTARRDEATFVRTVIALVAKGQLPRDRAAAAAKRRAFDWERHAAGFLALLFRQLQAEVPDLS